MQLDNAFTCYNQLSHKLIILFSLQIVLIYYLITNVYYLTANCCWQIVNAEKKQISKKKFLFLCYSNQNAIFRITLYYCIFHTYKNHACRFIHLLKELACRSFACRIAFDVHTNLVAKNGEINMIAVL